MDRYFKEAGDLDLMDSKNDSNNYFRPAGDLDSSNYIQDSTVLSKTDLKVDISSIKTNAELLKYFSDNWMSNGKKNDIQNIKQLLEKAKIDLRNGRKVNFEIYLYDQKSGIGEEIPDEYVIKWGENNEHVLRRWDDGNLDYDYRITISNSSEITNIDTLNFLNELENQLAKEQLPLNFKYHTNKTDALIFYLKKDNLLDYVRILENMKKNNEFSQIISKFGNKKTFCGAVSEDSYYGVSLGSEHSLNPMIRGMKTETMTTYSAELMMYSFNNLMNKYNNDIDLINTSEMYSEMQRLHQIHQFGTVVNSEVPFWMNKDMYDDMQNVSNITNDNFDLLNKNRTSKVYFDSTDSKDYSNSYFQPAGDLEESKQHNIHSFENISTEKINNYLMTIVSGEEYPYECELGTMCSAGSLIVNLHQLIEMANDGSYNIITAQCFNPEMIAISFQQFNKKNNKYY